MITLGKLKWSNCFSYGSNNTIDFTSNPITQLVGLNGHGKSSIALIVELVLFNKNSKGTKTGRIINRYIEENFYTISLEFNKDGSDYFIDTKRASTQTVKFSKDGVDISAHTATATFKIIEEVLGFDHKSFCQLVYQSSAQSLEFLTATDTNRKKFLIDLLSLEKYTQAFDIFKIVTKEVQDEVNKIETSIGVISGWLTKHKDVDLLVPLAVLEQPKPPTDIVEERSKITEDLKKIGSTNKSITDNNTYKEVLDSIDLSALPIPFPPELDDDLIRQKTEHEKEHKDAVAFIAKVKALKNFCPTCKHPIDNSKQLELVGEKEEIQSVSAIAVKNLSEQILKIQQNYKVIKDNESKTSRWEQYHSLYNPELSVEILYPDELEDRVIALTSKITKQENEIKEIIKANTLAASHNARVEVITEQLASMRDDLSTNKAYLSVVNSRLVKLQILQKAFSTNGLIAFKIEGMVKDLEDLVNEYLAELSYGRFQLSFVISSEKLNVVISDNGIDVEMLELSSGERNRINVATLLAIRKLMQNLSNTKINLLILDETVESLDSDGKEKLVELLLKETHLNTFLISHGFTHALLEKINVVKEDNISRLE